MICSINVKLVVVVVIVDIFICKEINRLGMYEAWWGFGDILFIGGLLIDNVFEMCIIAWQRSLFGGLRDIKEEGIILVKLDNKGLNKWDREIKRYKE